MKFVSRKQAWIKQCRAQAFLLMTQPLLFEMAWGLVLMANLALGRIT